jgi:hypothetical protein
VLSILVPPPDLRARRMLLQSRRAGSVRFHCTLKCTITLIARLLSANRAHPLLAARARPLPAAASSAWLFGTVRARPWHSYSDRARTESEGSVFCLYLYKSQQPTTTTKQTISFSKYLSETVFIALHNNILDTMIIEFLWICSCCSPLHRRLRLQGRWWLQSEGKDLCTSSSSRLPLDSSSIWILATYYVIGHLIYCG